MILLAFQNKTIKNVCKDAKVESKGRYKDFSQTIRIFFFERFSIKCKDSLQQSSNLLTNLNFHMKEDAGKQKKPNLRNLTIM